MASAQHYDYHKEEGPAISWNGTQMFDARMLGAGGVSFLSSGFFAGAVNPALLPEGGTFSAGFSADYMAHEAFQYWGVNQGVTVKPSALSDQQTGLNALALSFSLKKVRLSAGWYVPALLSLPDFDFEQRYWAYTGEFSGREDTFFAAAAVSWGNKFDIGIKIDYIHGNRNVEINEYHNYYTSDGYPVDSYLLIRHSESHKLTCIVPTVGVTFKFSPTWTLDASLVYPFKGNAERTLNRTFDNQYEPPISDTLNGKDRFFRPPKIQAGTRYTWHPRGSGSKTKLTIALESTYVVWSGYEFVFFSEDTPRDMRNCLILAAGAEYGIFRNGKNLFIRTGYRFDPQPLKDPKFTLHTFTFGTGFRYGKFTTDIGFAYYIGPSDVLRQRHYIINGTIGIDL